MARQGGAADEVSRSRTAGEVWRCEKDVIVFSRATNAGADRGSRQEPTLYGLEESGSWSYGLLDDVAVE